MQSQRRASRSWGTAVVGVDVDPHKLEPLERGVSPIVEPGLDELVATGVESGRLRVSSDLAASAATPTSSSCPSARRPGATERSTSASSSGSPRSSAPSSRSRSSFLAIVYRSTVPPGTVDGRMRPILEEASGRKADDAFGIGMVPEFLREGSSVADFFDPPFTAAGVRDDRTLALVTGRFAAIEQPIHAAFDRGCRVAQVRVQRVPRGEDHLRERDRAPPLGGRRRRARRHARVLRGPPPQRLPRVSSARLLVRRIVSAEGPARPDAPRADRQTSTCRC